MQRLAQFIHEHRDAIIADWETFAHSRVPAGDGMTREQLRDHASELLDAAEADLETGQTADEQRQKAKGMGRAQRMAAVARKHGMHRMQSGFRLTQVLSEFRALRASIVRLWEEARPATSPIGRGDLTRFHEAIDEALTESVNQYSEQLDLYRDQFLAVLGHDLRNPLGAIAMSATSLSRAGDLGEKYLRPVGRILRAEERMSRMVNDLLDLTRTRLGDGIPIQRSWTNLGQLCSQVVDELEAFHPDRSLRLECAGNLSGDWDSDRVAQIVSNLVANALQHGDPARAVTIRAFSIDDAVVLTVQNYGRTIPPASMQTIFDPMVRSADGDADQSGRSGNLGLGLFIVCAVATAHGGTVRVTSTDEEGTTFTVTLPRQVTDDPALFRSESPSGASPH